MYAKPQISTASSTIEYTVDESTYRAVISGERRGVLAAALRPLLTGLAVPYGAAVRARNWAYQSGWLTTHCCTAPVISVGNLTAGGTGKTPFVALLVGWFRTRGISVAILSRGYRAHAAEANDEKLVLDALCPGVPHVQDADRVAGARRAICDYRSQVLIVDDGFQHRRLQRRLDIVLIDATNPWGYGRLLPRGLLREPADSLHRADMVVLTRVDQCDAGQRQRIRAEIAQLAGTDSALEVAFRSNALVNSQNVTEPVETLTGQPVVGFCGIGNPDSFRTTLQSCGLDVREFLIFRDHHHYCEADLQTVLAAAEVHHVAACLTTQKDLVKIRRSELGSLPLWALRIGAEVVSGRPFLDECLSQIASAWTSL